MNIDDEKELVLRARKDPEAFGEIFDAYYDPIFGYVLRRVGDVQASQDITSEVFFKALNKLWQFKWKDVSISSWLYKIATNEINQYFRRNKRTFFSLEEVLERGGYDFKSDVDVLEEIVKKEEAISRSEKWIELRGQLELLPEKYQEVLVLRFFEDKKINEICEILGKKEGTVKSLLHRGIVILKRKCGKECNLNEKRAFQLEG